MKCPYNPKVICAYRENKDSNVYECSDCPHYDPSQARNPDPIQGRSMLGCLFVTVLLVAALLFVVGWFIKSVRSENHETFQTTQEKTASYSGL